MIWHALLWLGIWFVFWNFVMALVEYFVHRYTMHRKVTWLPDWIFEDHAIQHHHHDRNDINIDLTPTGHCILFLPIGIACLIFGWWSCLAAMAIVAAGHSYLWTKTHRAIHGIEDNWVSRIPYYYQYTKRHHEGHHQRPGKNFGAVYPWTDYLFGTKL